MFLTIPPIESEWNSVLSSCFTSLPFLDLRSRMFRTMPLIPKWVKFTYVSSRKSRSFLDLWSTMFCTFWLMERRMDSPLLSTKLSSRSPTTEVPSTANIRQSSDMFRTCLSSWKVARNRVLINCANGTIISTWLFVPFVFGVLSCSKHEKR